MQINLKSISVFKQIISSLATKSSLCRQTVWALKPKTAFFFLFPLSELSTTNTYQTLSCFFFFFFYIKAMKQSSVLLHSKVKKVLYRGSLISLSFHIHQLCTIWTWTNRAKCIAVHSPCIVLCELILSGGRSAQAWMTSELFVLWEKINTMQFLFGIRHFLTVHIDRATTKFPDMLPSAETCAHLRGDAVKKAENCPFLLSSKLFFIAFFPPLPLLRSTGLQQGLHVM